GDGRRFSLAAPTFALHIAEMVYRRIEFSGSGWRGRIGTILAVALGLGLAAALLLLSLGIALLLLPVVAIAFLIGRWRWKKIMAEATQPPDAKPEGPVIELDYEVVDRERGDAGDGRRR